MTNWREMSKMLAEALRELLPAGDACSSYTQQWLKGKAALKRYEEAAGQTAKCVRCGGKGQVWITDRVVQGQDYGPETEGHYESCPFCT